MPHFNAHALVLLLLAAVSQTSAETQAADLVLRGGKVVTMVADAPLAEAIAMRADRITAVGNNQEIEPLIGPATRVIELDGRLAIPGLIEGHGHFVSLGESKMVLDLSQAVTWEDIVDQVAAAALTIPAGQWIVGRGWHQGKWSRPPDPNVEGYPVHAALSQRTPQHPVILTHGSGHMLFANALAMQLAGVDEQTAEVAGGEILRNGNDPTGAFRENAMALVRRAHNQSLRGRSAMQIQRDLLQAIRLAGDECLANGITSFQDAGASLAEVDLFRELAERDELDVRLWVMLNDPNAVLANRLSEYRLVGVGNHHLTVRAIKRMVDGALGTHGAWLLSAYDDLPSGIGHNTTSVASLQQSGKLALENGFQLCVHAIGDRANREVLDLFEFGIKVHGKDLRWRIEHAQHIATERYRSFWKVGRHCFDAGGALHIGRAVRYRASGPTARPIGCLRLAEPIGSRRRRHQRNGRARRENRSVRLHLFVGHTQAAQWSRVLSGTMYDPRRSAEILHARRSLCGVRRAD